MVFTQLLVAQGEPIDSYLYVTLPRKLHDGLLPKKEVAIKKIA